MTRINICDNCLFSDFDNVSAVPWDGGSCRIRASSDPDGEFPQIYRSTWCGEWKPDIDKNHSAWEAWNNFKIVYRLAKDD